MININTETVIDRKSFRNFIVKFRNFQEEAGGKKN